MSPSQRRPTGFLRGFAHAFRGIARLFQTQRNARVHAVAALAALALGWALQISATEWIAILLCIALVLSAEAFNSALEHLADRVETKTDPFIRDAKDLAAGATLILALFAAIVGAIVFLPKLARIFSDGPL